MDDAETWEELSVARDQPKPAMVRLVDQMLELASGRSDEMLDNLEFRGPFLGHDKILTPEVLALADRLLDEHLSSKGFSAPWEVVLLAVDTLEAVSTDDSSREQDVLAVAQRMVEPFPRFPFILKQKVEAAFPFRWQMGGPDQLLLLAAPGDDRPRHASLAGFIQAPCREAAVIRVEGALDAVLGATRALGLLQFETSRRFQDEALFVDLLDVDGAATREDFEEGHWVGWRMAGAYADRVGGAKLVLPADLSDTERATLDRDGPEAAVTKRERDLRRVIAGDSARADEVRSACRLAMNAEHSLDYGVLVSLGFSCLEALLLPPKSKEDVLSKLSEAVAHSLGRSNDEREQLRKDVKRLYDVRSTFVHTGRAKERSADRARVIEIMYRALRREIEMLPDAPMTQREEGAGGRTL